MATKWTFEGEYTKSEKLGGTAPYELEVILTTNDERLARAVAQNSCVINSLGKKENENWKRWRTCQVVAGEDTTDKPTLEPKVEKLLIEAVNKGVVPQNFEALRTNERREQELSKAIERKDAAEAKAARKAGKKPKASKELEGLI